MNQKEEIELSPKEVCRRIQKFADDLEAERLNEKRVTFNLRSWGKRLRNFTSVTGALDANETPLAMWDISLLNRGNEGLLLTDRAVYSAHKMLAVGIEDHTVICDRISWTDIHSVRLVKNLLYINGREFFSPILSSADKKKNTRGLFAEIIGTVSKAKSSAVLVDPNTIPTIEDEEWQSRLSTANRPVLLLFVRSDSEECRARKVGSKLFLKHRYGSRFDFAIANYAQSPNLVKALDLTVVPAIALVHQGVPVAIVSGERLNLETATKAIDPVLLKMDGGSPNSETLSQMESHARQQAKQVSKDAAFGRWMNAVMSGIIAGALASFAFAKMPISGGLPIAGLVYGFCILNPLWRFNWYHRIIATGIMLLIVTNGSSILEILKSF